MKIKQTNKYQVAKEQFMAQGGYSRTAAIVKAGLSSLDIAELARSQAIVPIKRGLFRWHETESSSSLAEVSRIVPEGIVCLLSAVSYHELGTRVPWNTSLAIPMKARKPVLPEYPPIQLFYFSPLQYETGIMTVQVDDTDVRMYDPEKTLCDCARYRNKIGMDVFREAVAEYMRRPGRDIDKLLTYSRKLRIQSVIQRFAEALA